MQGLPLSADTPRPDPDPHDEYRPIGLRGRLMIALLAVVTTVVVVYLMFERPGGVQWKPPPPPPDRAACAPGQTRDCVGGVAGVIVPAAAASAPAGPASVRP